MDNSYNTCTYEAIFHKVSVIFNTLFSKLCETLYAIIVKLSASTSGHTTKTFFLFTVIREMAST
jgi:hypothetical protein